MVRQVTNTTPWILLAMGFAYCASLAANVHAEEHAHPEHGPHKGALVELGDEEYHAETVLDEKTHTLIIYLLGKDAKSAVAIDSKELVINLKHDGKAQQFKLKAAADKKDPAGKSSRFALKSEELVHALHDKNANPRLQVKIAGKSYSGKLTLDHDEDHKH